MIILNIRSRFAAFPFIVNEQLVGCTVLANDVCSQLLTTFVVQLKGGDHIILPTGADQAALDFGLAGIELRHRRGDCHRRRVHDVVAWNERA